MKKLIILLSILVSMVACENRKKVTPPLAGKNTTSAPSSTSDSELEVVDGVINGGGGKGVLCIKNHEQKVQILDMYEGQALYGLTYNKINSLSGNELIKYVAKKWREHEIYPGAFSDIDKELQRDVEYFKKYKSDNIRFIRNDQTLRNTNDADTALIEEGCQLVQVAVYYDESTLLIDPQYWGQLDEQNQAALILHEIYYQRRRIDLHEKTSNSTRTFIAHLLADQPFEPVVGHMLVNKPRGEFVMCSSEPSRVGVKTLTLFFHEVNGVLRGVVFSTRGQMPAYNTELIFNDLKLSDLAAGVFKTDTFDIKTPMKSMSIGKGFLNVSTNPDEFNFTLHITLPEFFEGNKVFDMQCF